MLAMVYNRRASHLFGIVGRALALGTTQSYSVYRGSSYGTRISMRFLATRRETGKTTKDDVSTLRTLGTNPVLSLDPEKFTTVGQQPVDVSRKQWATFVPSSGAARLSYPSGDPSKPGAFPPDTRGYLYYKRHADGQPVISGSMRFRVLPTGTSSFELGSDLQKPDGKPWDIVLYRIAQIANYNPVTSMLIRDGLVAQQTVDQLRKLPTVGLSSRSLVLYRLSEPFLTNLQYTPRTVFIITLHAMVSWRGINYSAFSVNHNTGNPFKGLLRVRLEKSPLPEHANTHTVVLRVLEILEPVECLSPQYKYHIAEPVAGELFMRKHRKGTKYTPWTFNLDKKGKNLDPLFVDDTTDP